jgi:hypothetical protein
MPTARIRRSPFVRQERQVARIPSRYQAGTPITVKVMGPACRETCWPFMLSERLIGRTAPARCNKAQMRPAAIVQQGLRTPTGPFSENCFIICIRGVGCGWRIHEAVDKSDGVVDKK